MPANPLILISPNWISPFSFRSAPMMCPLPIQISSHDMPPNRFRSAPLLCLLSNAISPHVMSPTDTDQPLRYIPYRCRSAPLICLPANTICLYDIPLPMPIRSSLSDFPSRPRLSALMICPYPFRSARPHANFVNLRWTSKHTQFNPPIFINKSLEKYKHTGPGCSKVG